MTRRIGIVTGISGVGKTQLLESVRGIIPMQVLSASALIRESLAEAEDRSTSYDSLCTRRIDANQAALIGAFNRHIDPDATFVVLDAHVVIDTPDGLVHVGSDVFREFHPNFILFIKDEPRKIYQKRKRDKKRSRPERSVDLLAKHQLIAIEAAHEVSNDLNIPIYVVNGGDADTLRRVLSVEQKATADV